MASWLITLLIIALNGFFVAAEFALVKVRWSQIDVLIKQWNSKAHFIKHAVDHLDDYLSACQLGITITSLALWWIAEPLIATQFIALSNYLHTGLGEVAAHAVAVPITFFVITVLHIVLGELAPKSLAIRDSLYISSLIIKPLYRFYRIFKPFIRLLNVLSQAFLRMFGITDATEELSHSEEELRMIVAESEEDGQINASERELIQNVFDFDDRQVSEIMTPSHKMFAINASTRKSDDIDILIREWYSRIPVYEEGIDNITWWILFKDIVSAHISKKSLDLHKLIRPIPYVPENMKIIDCLRLLQKSHLHIAIVISEYGNTIGVVTMEDILEELVGDIHDEGDEQDTIVTVLDDKRYTLDATASIADVNEHLPILLPESDEYETVSGYVNNLFGRIPSVNESIETDHYTITVTKRKKQRIDQVRLKMKEV